MHQCCQTYGLLVPRTNERVAVAILGGSDWRLGLDDGIDTTNYTISQQHDL